MCKITGCSNCRYCVYNYSPGAFDGACVIPDEYRTREKAMLYIGNHFDLLDKVHENLKHWIAVQAERAARFNQC